VAFGGLIAPSAYDSTGYGRNRFDRGSGAGRTELATVRASRSSQGNVSWVQRGLGCHRGVTGRDRPA